MTGCSYEAEIRRLVAAEQVEFHTYRKIMTTSQARTYLAQASAAERTNYTYEIGLAQRFQALPEHDRAAILAGFPRQGMSPEGMRFLWGEPYAQTGRINRYENWYYVGSSLSLAASGTQYNNFGTWVNVYFEDGRVAWWVDFVPSVNDDSSPDCQGC
jgi:hypothetical protein